MAKMYTWSDPETKTEMLYKGEPIQFKRYLASRNYCTEKFTVVHDTRGELSCYRPYEKTDGWHYIKVWMGFKGYETRLARMIYAAFGPEFDPKHWVVPIDPKNRASKKWEDWTTMHRADATHHLGYSWLPHASSLIQMRMHGLSAVEIAQYYDVTSHAVNKAIRKFRVRQADPTRPVQPLGKGGIAPSCYRAEYGEAKSREEEYQAHQLALEPEPEIPEYLSSYPHLM